MNELAMIALPEVQPTPDRVAKAGAKIEILLQLIASAAAAE
jgi:hypothetical protein